VIEDRAIDPTNANRARNLVYLRDVQLMFPHPNPSPQGEGLSAISGSLSLWERARVRAGWVGVSGKSHIAFYFTL
jgi:hypothetical protein